MFNDTHSEVLEMIKSKDYGDDLLQGNFGLEKENVRVNAKGQLATTKHPSAFGDKLKNPYIITDFSESQVEMITPVMESPKDCYDFLLNLHNIVTNEIEEEFLWPQSMPPEILDGQSIPIAEFNDTKQGVEARKYRERLAEKYGANKQLISGIHYNFSFKKSALEKLHRELNPSKPFVDFKNDIYMTISRNFIKYGWVLNYLMGTSVAVHKSYSPDCIQHMDKLDEESYYLKDATSIRNSRCGYKNPEDFLLSYNSLDNYISEISQLIKSGDIQSAAEYYSPIRLKGKDNKDVLNSLAKDGIEYIEIRSIDLNPEKAIGIDLDDVKFIHLFILHSLFNLCDCFDKGLHRIALRNWDIVASLGRNADAKINLHNMVEMDLHGLVIEILDKMIELVDRLGISDSDYTNVVKAYKKMAIEKALYSTRVFNKISEKSYIDYHMDNAKKYKDISQRNQYNLVGCEDLELSTQILIKDAIKRGVKVNILDRKENFISLSYDQKVEHVKQATKTSLDSYITFLMMENKVVTKKVLDENNIRVPSGSEYNEPREANADYDSYQNSQIVIKPKSTNFGIGITIFKRNFSKKEYEDAVAFAFSKDNTILVEEFIPGKEYRFFVIDDQVSGILHRVPANVLGDGKSTIRQLVDKKNEDPLRGVGYIKPLEKIKITRVEELFLKEQGLTPDDVLKEGETIYLRENSNISTGGDSIDYTDLIGDDYKKEAIRAAKSVDARICGVDMMINDITKPCARDSYAIIELNFNPAIHIHCYPFKGENRRLGARVLDALGFN